MEPSLSTISCRKTFLKQMGELQKQSFVDEVGIVLGNIYHWHATILGPPNNPFSGGKFVLNIHFRPEHPFKPPRVRFQTKIFHSNISLFFGGISMCIVRGYWSNGITMLKLLDSIRFMLIEPNLEEVHPDVADTTELYKNDRTMYDSTAQSWTQLYTIEENAQYGDSVSLMFTFLKNR